MKLALLGNDEHTLDLAEGAVRGGHRLVWGHELGDHAAEIQRLDPNLVLAAHWEALIETAFADAVIVARGDVELREEQLRKLASGGVPLLVSHPVHPSMLLYYELDMIRRETGGVLLPYLPSRWHPAVGHLQDMVTRGILGELQQAVLERSASDRSRRAVQAQFAPDVDVLRQFAGDLTKLGAMDSGIEEPDYGNLGVQLSGPSGVLARWSLEPSDGGGRLTLLGSQGKATLVMPEEGDWQVETPADRRCFNATAVPGLALESLAQAIDGESLPVDWLDAARSVELAETIDRSLKKGRVVELHLEDHTEEGTFKGTMTSLGCGLMLLCLLGLVLASLPNSIGLRVLHYFPHMLGGLLAMFLVLQLLKFAFPQREPTQELMIDPDQPRESTHADASIADRDVDPGTCRSGPGSATEEERPQAAAAAGLDRR